MKNSEKVAQNAPNLDTSSPEIENSTTNEAQKQVKNPLNFDAEFDQTAANLSKMQVSSEKAVNLEDNSIISTCNFGKNHNFTENANLDTSKIIIDPLSVIDTKNLDNSASFEHSQENEKLVFSKLFPNVSLENLEKDELFCLFSSHNGKNIAISELYTNYLRLINAFESDFARKSAVLAQNKLASPGSLASSEKTSDVFFTKEQVLRMSAEQISKNYETIRKSQQKW